MPLDRMPKLVLLSILMAALTACNSGNEGSAFINADTTRIADSTHLVDSLRLVDSIENGVDTVSSASADSGNRK